MSANRSSGEDAGISETAAIAPALIIGFFGVLDRGSTLISLNASPEGSTPIEASTTSGPTISSASA